MDFSETALDIIIEGGQSNSEGCGLGPVEKEYIPTSKILYLEAEKEVKAVSDSLEIKYFDKPFSISVAKERGQDENLVGDLSLTFSEEYIKKGFLKEDRALLIIRGAIGGTGFKKGHWGLKDKVYLKMLEMIEYALSLNADNRVVAFLWHQGEHDAFEKNPPEIYYKQLKDMVKDVRFHYGNMPFIAGDFANEWKSKNLEQCKPIIETIRKVVQESGYAKFVETDNLLSNNQKVNNGDDIHFCRQSLHELGYRYFAAWESIKK